MSKLKQVFAATKKEPLIEVSSEEIEECVEDVTISFETLQIDEELVDGFIVISEGLESICDFVESTLEDGGLNKRELTATNLAIESYTNRLGLGDEVIVSVESLTEENQLEVTTVSMEAVKDTVKKIWEAIKKAIKKAVDAATAFFKQIFNGVDKILDRVGVLEKMVDNVGDKKAQGEVSVSGANYLHTEGKVDPNAINKGLDNLSDACSKLYGGYAKGVADYYKGLGKMMSASNTVGLDSEEEVDSTLEDFEKDVGGLMKTVESLKGKVLSGGKVIETAENPSEGMKFFIPTLNDAKEGQSVKDSNIDPLTTAEMKKVLASVKEIAETIKSKKAAVDTIDKGRAEAVKGGDEFANKSDQGKLGKGWTKAKVRAGFTLLQLSVTKPINQTTSHAFKTAKAALALVERSVKAYKDAEASTEEKEEKVKGEEAEEKAADKKTEDQTDDKKSDDKSEEKEDKKDDDKSEDKADEEKEDKKAEDKDDKKAAE